MNKLVPSVSRPMIFGSIYPPCWTQNVISSYLQTLLGVQDTTESYRTANPRQFICAIVLALSYDAFSNRGLSKFTAMIILHFDLQPQFKYMNYFIYTSHPRQLCCWRRYSGVLGCSSRVFERLDPVCRACRVGGQRC